MEDPKLELKEEISFLKNMIREQMYLLAKEEEKFIFENAKINKIKEIALKYFNHTGHYDETYWILEEILNIVEEK